AVLFVARAEHFLSRLANGTVDEEPVRELRSIITGGSVADSARGVVRYIIEDKHGYRQGAFHLRAQNTFAKAAPMEVGLRTTGLTGFDALPLPYDLPGTGRSEPVAAIAS